MRLEYRSEEAKRVAEDKTRLLREIAEENQRKAAEEIREARK